MKSLSISDIDGGTPFDWGKTSDDYAKYRDIYPPLFFQKIIDRGLCTAGQNVLDLGTGTGVVPRALAQYGAKWTGADISPEQIAQAKALSERAGLPITYIVSSAEALSFPRGSFDVVTACQCFWYFDPEVLLPKLHDWLVPGGKLLILFLAWLPYDDPIAGESEKLVLQFSPKWSGAGQTRKKIWVPELTSKYFTEVDHEEYDLPVHFTRESWNGRMRACRGVGASLPPDQLAAWETAHRALLNRIAPEEFDILHTAAMLELQRID